MEEKTDKEAKITYILGTFVGLGVLFISLGPEIGDRIYSKKQIENADFAPRYVDVNLDGIPDEIKSRITTRRGGFGEYDRLEADTLYGVWVDEEGNPIEIPKGYVPKDSLDKIVK